MDRMCPCGSGAAFAACCAPYISGTAHAPTAEALMRSRYTAFCEGAGDYLFETHDQYTRSPNERAEIERSIAGTAWTNLLIIKTQKGRSGDTEGHVEFAAAFRQKRPSVLVTGATGDSDPIKQMHERSFFICDEGRWFYVDGDQLDPYRPKPNEPCWCGSGTKAKKCHG